MSRVALLALLLLLPLAVSAVQSVDTSKCDDDGVTDTPAFAERPGGGATCLEIDPGNGDADVIFQYEHIDVTDGTNDCAFPGGTQISFKKGTATSTQFTSIFVYNSVIDNYSHQACANDDIVFIAGGENYANQWIYIKNTQFINGWKCSGSAWTGTGTATGLSCSATKSKAHSDGIQLRGTPVENGWFVFQDSQLVNGHNFPLLGQVQPAEGLGPLGSWSFQGSEIGRQQSIGLAETWIDDCLDRGAGTDICNTGFSVTDNGPQEFWMIDVYGTTLLNVKGPTSDGATEPGKVVIVNTGCSSTGCGQASIGYDSKGWPHPLTRIGNGGSVCPNGLITAGEFPTYCYTSLEAAALDHTLPPFAQLSCAGWATPPAGCDGTGSGSSAPRTTLSLSAGTIEEGETVTMTAVPSGGTGDLTVTYDYDGDGTCDDGDPDTTPGPFTQVTAAFNTAGSYTLKACVEDSATPTPLTGSRTAGLLVTPPCGDNVAEGSEVCDGSDLNGETCETQVAVGSTGTLVCTACAFDTSGCSVVEDSCGDGVCSPTEEAGTRECFEDCAEYHCDLIGKNLDNEWDIIASDMSGGERISLKEVNNNQLNMWCQPTDEWESGTGLISGFTWDWTGPGGDGTTSYDARQGGAPYMWCGDTGPGTIESATPCPGVDQSATTPLLKGEHHVVVTPCSVNPTGVIPGGPFSCPGTAGPVLDLTFEIVYPQVVLGQPGQPYLIVKE